MVFQPSRPTAGDELLPVTRTLSRGVQTIVDLLDTVGTIRDGEHLQSVAYLAEEFGLLAEPTFVFGSRAGRPHSLLLEGHFYALLCDKVIDRDGAGYLRPRRDLYALPFAGRAARRLRSLGALSSRDAMIFAAAARHLAQQGRYSGSRRHDAAFDAAVAAVAALHAEEEPAHDPAAI